MTPTPPPTALQGAARLATEGVVALVRLVEAMHEQIAHIPGTTRSPDRRTRGITGLVYRTVETVAAGVGGGVESLLGKVGIDPQSLGSRRDREALLSALNGVVGDRLAESGNPLAIAMRLRLDGEPLVLEPAALQALHAQRALTGRVVVLIHGLCMNPLQWGWNGHDHGAALARDDGWTPLYLHYNSGRHISQNGEEFAALLEQLMSAWPVPVERLALVGHSMGGLVARAAIHTASQAQLRWPGQLGDLVTLGTPHQGARLERAGHWLERALGVSSYSRPLAQLARVRSAGITDLRHGAILDRDWQVQAAARATHPLPTPVPLPGHVRCFALAGRVRQRSRLSGLLGGDGLVTVASALGEHRDPRRSIRFDTQRQWVCDDVNHVDLLDHPAVYAKLREWLAGGDAQAASPVSPG